MELIIGRNFGLPQAKSYMTTTCSVRELLDGAASEAGSVGSGGAAVDVELRVQTTTARQSTLAAAFPVFEPLNTFAFPSGDALDAVRADSSKVRLTTTYLSPTLRISRPRAI